MSQLIIRRRILGRLLANVYTDIVVEYLSQRFNIPKAAVSIAYNNPILPGDIRPDLVIMYNNTWFIIEFKTKPNLLHDIDQVIKYKQAIDTYIKPRRTIPILAYVYRAPLEDLSIIEEKKIKPLVILHLIHGSYKILYEALE